MASGSFGSAATSVLDEDDYPILVATDGHPHADPAMAAAAFIAGRTGGNVQIFSAIERDASQYQDRHEPSAIALGSRRGEISRPWGSPRDEVEMRRAAVETQMALTVGEAASWPITVRVGPFDQTSHDVMRDCHAQLLVLGQRDRRRVPAPPGVCHATQILAQSVIPVYIAAPTLRGIARRVVVATDFSVASLQATHVISRLSAADATIYLVHVLPGNAVSELEARRRELQAIEQSVRLGSDVRIESVLLVGPAAQETLAFADGIHADVIACGASSLPVFPSARPCPPTLGRVTRELLRQASCSMLIHPQVSDAI